MTEKKKPLSLNDRHNRLLQDLSASHPSKPRPIEEERKTVKVKLEGRRRLCKDASDDGNDDFSRFSEIANIETQAEHPVKVKMEGRRRLCKVSSAFDNYHENVRSEGEFDGPRFSVLSDYESPPAAKNVRGSAEHGAGNEIRDILNELSSKLEFMSIERKRNPDKWVDPVKDTASLIEKEAKDHDGHADLPGFTSVTSSIPHVSDFTPDMFCEPKVEVDVKTSVHNYQAENYLHNESEGDNFVSELKEPRNKNNSKGQAKDKLQTIMNVEDDEDDCIIISNKGLAGEVQDRCKKFEDHSDVSVLVDEVDDGINDFVPVGEYDFILSGSTTSYRLQGKIAKMLYPHQRDGLKWLWSLHSQGKGGILGDDMGLGKTMQICGFLAGLFHSNLINRALVVSPKTLLPHWIKELSAVGLSEKTREYYGTCAKARQYELRYVLEDNGILLTTYDIVRNNSKSLRGVDYHCVQDDDIMWDYMILDEGHLIKNPSTQRAKSLFEIPSAHRIIISGTPIQNNLKELWALFNFCCPELLGDKNWFKEKYEHPILRGNEKNASDREKRVGSYVAKELRERIQPYFLRRLKNEIFCEDDHANAAQLSKKREIIVWLKLTPCQRQLYQAFLNSEIVLSAFDGSPLAALTILKKICDHPLLLTKRAAEDVLEGMDSMPNQEDAGFAEKLAMQIADVTEEEDFQEKNDNVSCKISFILALLDNLIPEGHNVLIFSQTRKMLNLIQDSLVSKGYEFSRIDGTTKASDRVKIVNDFQEGIGASIFLLTSQVGGLGLTLTRADRVIVVDPAWNPSTDNQSVDRAYRIGQTKDVIVYRLMTCGTVEEKIYRKQIFKGGLFKTATEHKEQIRYFSQQDLRELFSLPKQGFDVSPTQQQLHEEHDSQYAMDESLKDHLKFIENLGIAGVSHHSLLFSKTATIPAGQVEEEVEARVKKTTRVWNSSSSSLEHNVDGAIFAFNPKDVKLHENNSSESSTGKPTEAEIKERIDRLSHTFADKAMISKLPDKGEKIQKQIAELNVELDKLRMARIDETGVIDLDDITGELQRVLNV